MLTSLPLTWELQGLETGETRETTSGWVADRMGLWLRVRLDAGVRNGSMSGIE